ncbi:hypothetical protein [Trinickia diaoshuihuensis]|uniref:hypothetical protein n=1 Tax=Trinickia diaoshuihuensis TaxID=2292265 RepID=UPI000E23A38C|nr:hypothetical protein [Trinickia diaoshuihuensis]
MTDKNEDKQHKALMTALEKIQAPLEALAVLKLADEFYTKEERAKLYADYTKLRAADMAAYEVLHRANEGKDQAAHTAAFEAKKAASQALMAFEKEHQLVLRLLDARATLSKSRYD